MKRKKFIKKIMAMGISRNTAGEMADAAARAEIPLAKTMDRVRIMRSVFMWRLCSSKQAQADFERSLLIQARITPRRIHPLRRKKRGHSDGLSAQFAVIDELHILTHTNAPGTGPVTVRFGTAGGGGNE